MWPERVPKIWGTPVRVLVTGANGRTGRPIVSALATKGMAVRAFLRKANQVADLEDLGAESCAIGDMTDKASIAAAVESCDKIVHIGPPVHPLEVEITAHFIEAATQGDVSHFIYYSVMHPLRREVRHHRLKLDAEEKLIESALPYTIVQPCRYMQHLEPIWSTVMAQGVHAMPFSTEKKFSIVDLLDLAEAVAIVAGRESDHYATYELAGPEPLSQVEMARIISSVTGKEISARATPIDAMKEAAAAKGLPNDMIEQMVIMNTHYDQHGFLGNPNVLRWLLGRELTTFENYVRRLSKK